MIANAGKRFLSLLLAIVMVVGMMPQIPLSAKAAVNGSFTNTNLSASSSDGTWTISNGNTISTTVTTKSSSNGCGGTNYTKVSTTVTLTNGYAEAAKLDIDATMAGNGTISGAISAAGLTTLDIPGNSSVTITVTSANNSTAAVTLTLALDLYVPDTEQTITNTYLPAENGSYSVDGETVDADGSTVGKIYGSTSTLKVVSSAEGYKFFSWYNATTGTYVSDQEEYTITYEKGTQIKPVFMRLDGALFGVGSATFCDLTEAVNYAQKTSATKIVLLNNGTLYGAHTIPTGITFLISFDDSTLYTTAPDAVNGNSTTWVKPTQKRMLTMADGANLTIKGAMSLSNKIYAAHSPNIHAGSPHGECAFVTMNKGSSITVENGGTLYAWGFITGPGVKNGDVSGSGTITAKDGATVYECFQVTDWRGGTAISKIGNGVFPLSQFYVQNIEVPLTLEHGAKESGYTAIHASIIGVQGTSVGFIGTAGSMFAMSSGSVKKWYNGAKDRLVVEATGDLSISGVTMAVPGAGNINSSQFNLGINSNITVKINSGSTIAINQDVALYPGSEIIVEEGAICTLGTPGNEDKSKAVELYVYDKDQWGGYVGSGNAQFIALDYAPGRSYNRNVNADIVDAKVQVDGTIDATNGYLYTTAGGGNVFTNGTGKITMKAAADTVTKQYVYGDSSYYVDITVTSVQLHNVDTSSGTAVENSAAPYTTTVDATAVSTYVWSAEHNRWVKTPFNITFKYDENTADGDTEKIKTQPITETEIKAGKYNLKPYGDLGFTAADGYVFTHWTNADTTDTTKYVYDENGKLEVNFYQPVTLIGHWAEQFTMKFDLNGATSPESIEAIVEVADVDITDRKPADPKKTGNTFLGWKVTDDADGSVVSEKTIPDTMPARNTTATAMWEINKYTVTFDPAGGAFDSEGGSDVKTITQDYGTSMEAPDQPSREGYDFDGWYNGDSKVSFPFPLTDNITLKAKWTEKEFTIKFNPDNGSAVVEITQKYNTPVNPAEPKRTGYTFVGWYDGEAKMDIPFNMPVVPEEGLTLTAHWEEAVVEYKIETYLMNTSGNYEGVKPTTVTLTEKTNTPVEAVIDTGKTTFTFDEDCKENVLSGTVAADGSLVLKVYYARNQYVFKTVVDDVETSKDYFYGALIDEPAEPAKADYIFMGWEPEVPENMPDKDVTVVAQWAAANASYTVETYIMNTDGSYGEPTTETIKYPGGMEVFAKITERANYTVDEGLSVLSGTVATDNSLVLKVYYKLDQYTFTIDVDGDKTEIEYYYGAPIATPTKPEKPGHTFREWEPDVPQYMPANDVTVKAVWDVNLHTVTWKNANGFTLETDRNVPYGTMPSYDGAIPTQEATAQFSYHFAGWDKEISMVTGDVTYTATYTATTNSYTITFVNEDGTELQSSSVEYGTVPEYTGDAPTKEATAQYTYHFKGWDKDIVAVTGDTTYKATYNSTTNTYTVTWENADGKVLEKDENVPYGTLPTYDGTTPAMAADAQYTYTFRGWDPAVSNVIGHATYTAQYSTTINTYKVEFLGEDRNVLMDGSNIAYGTNYPYPADQMLPSKADTAQFDYEFAGWDLVTDADSMTGDGIPEESFVVTGNMTYVPLFSATVRTYTVTFFDENGQTVLDTQTVEYGKAPVYGGEEPTKEQDEQFIYSFDNWDLVVNVDSMTGDGIPEENLTVTGNMTYVPLFSKTVRTYTVTWVDEDGTTVLEKDENVPYGTAPSYNSEAPTKEGNAQYSYSFAGWDGKPETVSGNVTIKATYSETVNKYRITFLDDDGKVLKSEEVAYGETPTCEVPTKEATAQYTYHFTGWNEEIVAVTGEATYQATYDSTINTYTVTWKNWEGTVLETDEEVPYGTTPEYNQEKNPTREKDAQYTYTFKGWDAELKPIEGDVTYTATYTETLNKYTVNWVGENGEILETDTDVEYGTTPEFNGEEPAKARTDEYIYTFAGWDAGDGKVTEEKDLVVTGEMNYTVVFDAEGVPYTIYWDLNGDNTPDQIDTVKFGEKITIPTAEPKEGYSAVGWNGTVYEVMPARDLLFVVEYKINEYTITFDAGEGVFADGKHTHEVKDVYQSEVKAPDAPTREGYTFLGWDQEIQSMPGENLTVHAKWEVNKATFLFYDGETLYYTHIVKEGDLQVDAPADPAAKTGYTFRGWLDANGDSVTFPLTELTNGMTLHADWVANQYIVTFHANDGTDEPDTKTQNVTFDAEVKLNANTFKREGYSFRGWATAANSNTVVYADQADYTHAVDKNVDLYALWQIESYTVTWDVDGEMTEETCQYGATINKPADPQKEGYTFAGWVDENNEPVETTAKMPAKDIVIKATWTPKEYKVTWIVDGVRESVFVEFGTKIKEPENLSKEGHAFAGWDEEIPDSMPAENLTFVATWTPKEYKVTWIMDGIEEVTTYQYGAAVTAPAVSAKEGYAFAGWTNEEGETVAVPAEMPAQNLIFTAKLEPKPYTVTWIVDGVTTKETYDFGTKIKVPENLNKEGHTFAGWLDESENTAEIPLTMPAGDRTFKADWTVNTYTVKWIVDGNVTATRSYPYGTAIAKQNDPSKSGYTFAGWEVSNGYAQIPAKMPAVNLEITATWTVNQYTVIWNVDGKLIRQTGDFGEKIDVPADPEKEGHTFASWMPDNGYTEVPETIPAVNLTITATWTVNEYSISWDTDGDGNPDDTTEIAYGSVIGAEKPTREGFTFTGWTITGKSGAYGTQPSKMPAEDLTYQANWQRNKYDVTWNVDGKLETVEYAFEEEIIKIADPVKIGHVFKGWSPAVLEKMPAEDQLYTAIWEKDEYTVTWDIDGRTRVFTYEFGDPIEKLENPTKTGYSFVGWDIQSTSGYTYIPNTMPAEELTFTAKWAANNYTITWKVDDQTTTDTYAFGEKVTAPANPAKAGHRFIGWDNAIPETMVAENLVITAQWQANRFTITFNTNGGGVISPFTADFGELVEKPADPRKTGYGFIGWQPEIPDRMPAEDLVVTAQWDPNDYIITFYANNGTDDNLQQTAEHNVPVTLDWNVFTYEGYDFKGWATDKDSTEIIYENGETVRVTGNIALYAIWEEIEFTITWNVDGDTTTTRCAYGTPISLLAVPEKPGHTFDGWLDEAGMPVTASTKMPARDMVVTASWNVNYYDITWDTDGDGDVDDTTSVAYGEMPVHAEGSRASVPQYDYTFIRWEPELAAVTGEAAYKAKFEAVDRYYDVTFVTNVDGITVDPVNVKYGDSITLQTLRREGYTFKGWSTNPVSSEGVNDTYTVTGETTLYAIWSANVYQLSFVNEFGLTMTYRQYYGTAVELPEQPVQEGYTFQGWINQKDASAGIPETVPAEHLTFVADWQINQYSITFANTGDTAMEPIIQDYGTVIMAPADPVRVGYTFKGWDKEIPAIMPAEDMTITAKWERNVYTIRWDINGDGTVDVLEEEYTEELEHGKMPTVQTGRKAPDKQYTYIFDGWAPEVTEATSDQVYTAQFTTTTNEYKISWDYDGDGNVDDAAMVAYGVMPNHSDVTKKSDEKYIYTFTGWYPELAEVTGEALYTAQYDTTGVKYTVNFLLDQNGGIVKSITAGYGTPIEVPENPTKPGYTFVDWDKEIPETMPVYGATITARWSINTYTITFDSDGGTDVASITTRFEGPVTAPAAPTRTGYTFAGWQPAVPATMPAENMTLTAQWTPNQYTITFGSNGGSQVEAITQAYGSAVTAPADPVREGYTFAGWDQEVPATMPAENITLTAKWTPNAYDVRFYTDDSMTELHATVSADCDAGFQLPAEPTRAGYNFGGWFWVDQEGNEVAIPTIMIAGGMDVYAKWNVGTFTIQFNTDGGSVVESITAEYGAEITAPADPEKEGYSFAGWDAAFPATMPAESMTLNAVWKINQYTIRFNTDGGSEIASITQDYNTAVTAPAENPTKAGYTFAGWDAVIPTVMPARNVTINARWAANRYTITFNTNGGTPIESITADFGAALTAPAAPVKTGYVFAGWDVEFPATMPVDGLTLNAQWAVVEYAINWDTDGDGTVDDTTNVAYDTMPVHADGARPAIAEYTYVFSSWDPKISVVRGTATYTALFDIVPNEYTITFDTNGGSEIAPVTYAYGTAVAEPAAPTKEGYTFAGWDALPGTMPAKNVKVVAQWKVVDYTITFDTAGGTAVAPITAGYNTTIAAPNDPTREGYTFAGWTPVFPETMPLNGMTLTAAWKINQYTIRFNSDGGTEVASITQDYGTAVTAPAAPTKEGYTFQGWNAEIPATMPARDMTFTALWKYTYSGWLTDDIGTTYLKNGEKAYYAQWANIGGKDYYFDSEGYIVKGLYQTWSMDDDYEATFLFDEETGVFCKDVTTVYDWNEKLYYVENGEVINYPGLVRIVREDGEINYYYFGSDNEAVKDGTYTVTQNNDLLPVDPYIFGADGVIEHHEDTSRNGIHEEDGKKYYYIDGVKVHMGLVEVDGEYYYASNGGELICGRTYWITRTNDLLPEMAYTFDEEGKIVFETEEPEEPEDPTDPTDPEEPTEPEEPVKPVKNGIYAEDGSLFYYENDQRTYGGLMEIGGYYYYAKINGEIIHGRSYWVTKTNDLMAEGSYAFDDQGRMILAEEPDDSDPSDPTEPEVPTEPVKNGIYAEDGSLYYYENGERTYAGLIEIDGYYYYVRTSAEVVHGRSYWITKTNGILPEKSYTFDDQGRMIDVTPNEKDTGKNGIYAEDGSLYYYENGLRTYGGLMEIDGYYYYAKTNGEVVNGRKYWITKTNDLMPETSYYFDSQGRMIIQEDPSEPLKNGIYAEDGSLYYYENGERTYAGVIILDGYYYYVKTNCEVVHGCKYWISKTNGLIPEMSYTFDDQGRIQDTRPENDDQQKNGIYKENGTLYYYVDGHKAYAGLIQIDGEYYYAKSDGAIVCGRKYWITRTNGIMEEGYYTFDADGRMVL